MVAALGRTPPGRFSATRERVIRVRYRNREQATADLFEYIEVFYNRKRRHGYHGNISPVDFERQSNGSF